jgi:DNA polymerase-1
MSKLLLIDANSLIFRAYYATAYGNMMVSKSGQPTNALFGFTNMIVKAIGMIQPTHILFAFDAKAKTFRHEQFQDYKGTRKELPQELIDQFLLIREFLDACEFPRFEVEGFEADDIIGTSTIRFDEQEIVILSSDKDLLQLINDKTEVILMKKGLSETLTMNLESLRELEGILPYQVIEMKALMGDSADNIPGVPNVGEKTAKKLIESYQNIDVLYENINDIKGKLKENLVQYKDQAYLSKHLATIIKDIPLPFTLQNLEYQPNFEEGARFLRMYDMNTLSQSLSSLSSSAKKKTIEVNSIQHLGEDKPLVVYFNQEVWCVGHDEACVVFQTINEELTHFLSSSTPKVFIDVKRAMHEAVLFNVSIQAYDDALIIVNLVDSSITSVEKLKDYFQLSIDKKNMLESDIQLVHHVSKTIKNWEDELVKLELTQVYSTIEKPLTAVLFDMERLGIKIDEEALLEIAHATSIKINEIEKNIQDIINQPQLNLNSPKQLATVLFDELNLPANKQRSTNIDILESLVHHHPIIPLLIEYRKYQKFYSTYALGLQKYVSDSKRIHTEYSQVATSTGRLSSNNPNLQNISVRNEDTVIIRKIFIPDHEDYVLLAADYSQIELRLLAHLSSETKMIEAFQQGIDIHTKTAMDIYHVDISEVTSIMRRAAKAVNFGIVYGISDFGLSEQLKIDRKEASLFIQKYHQSFPRIMAYMDEVVSSAQRLGYASTMFLRRRIINELSSPVYSVREFGKRAAMNAPIQGTAADLIKIAMVKLSDALNQKQAKSKLILQVHDELVVHAAKDELPWLKPLMKDIMENVVELSLPLEVSMSEGSNWMEAK